MSAPDEGGLWMSISELAVERGLDKSVISRRVAQLEADGLLTTRKGTRGAKLVNVAAFVKASGDTGDLVRSLAVKGELSGPKVSKVLAHEQARRVAFQADLAQLDLDERLGRLVPTDSVIAAGAACAEAVVNVIEQLPSRADEVAAAVGRDGPAGARAVLRTFVQDIRAALERAMAEVEAQGIAQHAATKEGAP